MCIVQIIKHIYFSTRLGYCYSNNVVANGDRALLNVIVKRQYSTIIDRYY